jgi:hypothetical protein
MPPALAAASSMPRDRARWDNVDPHAPQSRLSRLTGLVIERNPLPPR